MASSTFGKRQRARIMITVKTYPELSNKYRETSCVAGIRLDQGEPQHVRLFPVPFRLLSEDAQFSKYSIIEVDVEPHRPERDSRPAGSPPCRREKAQVRVMLAARAPVASQAESASSILVTPSM